MGIEAFSCDIINSSGGHPEYHIQQNVLELLNGKCHFATEDGEKHFIQDRWDAIIAFPPCTHLAVSGARHFVAKRNDGRQYEGIDFFCQFFFADCEHIAIENPVNIISGDYCEKWFPELVEKYNLPRKPTQVIQPYMFGDPFEKKTCLWLKRLPILKATNIVEPPPRTKYDSGKSLPTWYANMWRLPKDERAKERSKTFPGVAKAMAYQWGTTLKEAKLNGT